MKKCEPKDAAELLVECRQWMQSALEELTLCPTVHTTGISLREGEGLLDKMDATLRGSIRVVADPEAESLKVRLREIEGALVALSKAFESLDALVRSARAVESATLKRPVPAEHSFDGKFSFDPLFEKDGDE